MQSIDDSRQLIPLVGDLMAETREIPPDLKVKEVVEIFRGDHRLLILPIVSSGVYVGSVSRKSLFFHHLSHKYALDLYGNKPIRVLKDENPVVMEPYVDITAALELLLDADPSLETDSFVIVGKGLCLGIVSVSDLMMKISESQKLLLDALNNLSARIREEVALAGRIQQDLLPEPEFRFKGITVGAGITTSTEIGGDFYDYFVCGEGQIGLIIADVSGHGVQSGMVTTAAKASLHTLISLGVTTPGELLAGMNRAIIATARRTLLMSCLIAVIDTESGRLRYANAGHNFPYLYCGGLNRMNQLQDTSGFPLGLEEDSTFREYSIDFNEGDVLVLYTDGIVECTDENDADFGYERLEGVILDEVCNPPAVLINAVFDKARNFAGSDRFQDDATLLVASFSG